MSILFHLLLANLLIEQNELSREKPKRQRKNTQPTDTRYYNYFRKVSRFSKQRFKYN